MTRRDHCFQLPVIESDKMDSYFRLRNDIIPRFSRSYKLHKDKENLPEEIKNELKKRFSKYKETWSQQSFDYLLGCHCKRTNQTKQYCGSPSTQKSDRPYAPGNISAT